MRVALLALSASCASINAASRALDLGFGGSLLAAYCIIGIFCATIAALLVGFARELMEKALDESDDVPTGKTDTKQSHVEHISAARVHKSEDGPESARVHLAAPSLTRGDSRERSVPQDNSSCNPSHMPPQSPCDVFGEPADEGLDSPSPRTGMPVGGASPGLAAGRRPPGGVVRASARVSSRTAAAVSLHDEAPPRTTADCRSGVLRGEPVDTFFPVFLPGPLHSEHTAR